MLTYGAMVRRCLEAADRLAARGIDVEVVDLRTVLPLDMATIGASVRSTGRVVIVHEDTLSSGVGGEIAARLADAQFFDLDAPIRRVAAPDTPVPYARALEEAFIPSVELIESVIGDTARC